MLQCRLNSRATWHLSPHILEVLAANSRLEVMQFLVATPDLHPLEHVWNATRPTPSHNHTLLRLLELAADQFENHLTRNPFDSSFLDCYGFNAIGSMLHAFLYQLSWFQSLEPSHRLLASAGDT